jgi:hypothetical protein
MPFRIAGPLEGDFRRPTIVRSRRGFAKKGVWLKEVFPTLKACTNLDSETLVEGSRHLFVQSWFREFDSVREAPMFLLIKAAFLCAVMMVLINGTQAADNQSDPKGIVADEKSRSALDAWLNALSKSRPVPVPPKIASVDGAVGAVFPGERFYAIRYMRYPRAIKPPESLKLENLVCVHSDQSVERIADVEALKKLFEPKVGDVRDEAQARTVLTALLQLAEQFYQDGNYTFEVPEQLTSVSRQKNGGLIASGKAVVIKGGSGEISAIVRTDAPNSIEIAGKVRADVRLR